MQKSTLANKDNCPKNWFLVDASGLVVGRLAARLAKILQGKHKPVYTPFLDSGDFVIVINAEKVVLTGGKEGAKVYRHHSSYPGGLKEISVERLRASHPERIVEAAVRRMMPKTKLGVKMMAKLHVFKGDNDKRYLRMLKPQQPVALDLGLKRKGA